jgi:hypothetical protein
MTDEEKELLKTGAEAALRPFSNVIEKLFGGAAEELGGMWQDSLRVRRLARQVKLLEKVERIISDAPFEPQQIADNIWMPAWSYASMEDNDDLQERWAALLVNASRPDSSGTMNSSFPAILHELSPSEAKFLDALFDFILSSFARSYGEAKQLLMHHLRETDLGTVDGMISTYASAGLTKLSSQELLTLAGKPNPEDLTNDRTSYEIALNNLLRHRLIEVRDKVSLDLRPMQNRRDPEIKNEQRVFMTALGFSFVKACRKPEGEGA